jgi:hypothetical protein
MMTGLNPQSIQICVILFQYLVGDVEHPIIKVINDVYFLYDRGFLEELRKLVEYPDTFLRLLLAFFS